MELKQIIDKIEVLKKELDGLKPLKPEYQQKLEQKLRLDWNYNSNHIEGNTLTYGETKLLLIFGQTPENGGKDIREFDEMRAHDVAIKLVEELAHDKERPITESFIRQLNETILVRNFWKDAITPDGQPTKKEIKVGQYKTTPNSVRTSTGELFHYASPEETPAKMHDLLGWYKDEVTSNSHPLLIAALLHYKFVCIHPFDDGNGRISRLLMNYVLLKYDYPPAIIKSEDKKAYLTALNRADTGDTEAFVAYLGEQLIRSLELSIKAAKGESIEEQGDLDKEIDLLKRSLKNRDGIKVRKSEEVVEKVISKTILPLIRQIDESLSAFDDIFSSHYRKISFDEIYLLTPNIPSWIIYSSYLKRPRIHFSDLIKNETLPDDFSNVVDTSELPELIIELTWHTFKHDISKEVFVKYDINVSFKDYHFILTTPGNNKIEKRYDQIITIEEQNNLIKEIKKSIYEQIKSLSE